MPGALARTHGPVYKIKKYTSFQSPQVKPNHRHSLRDGFTVSFVVSPETGLYCLRHSQEALASLELDTSVGVSERYDFAVRLPHRSSVDAKASIASRTQHS
jgi:hypothetical protein